MDKENLTMSINLAHSSAEIVKTTYIHLDSKEKLILVLENGSEIDGKEVIKYLLQMIQKDKWAEVIKREQSR